MEKIDPQIPTFETLNDAALEEAVYKGAVLIPGGADRSNPDTNATIETLLDVSPGLVPEPINPEDPRITDLKGSLASLILQNMASVNTSRTNLPRHGSFGFSHQDSSKLRGISLLVPISGPSALFSVAEHKFGRYWWSKKPQRTAIYGVGDIMVIRQKMTYDSVKYDPIYHNGSPLAPKSRRLLVIDGIMPRDIISRGLKN